MMYYPIFLPIFAIYLLIVHTTGLYSDENRISRIILSIIGVSLIVIYFYLGRNEITWFVDMLKNGGRWFLVMEIVGILLAAKFYLDAIKNVYPY